MRQGPGGSSKIPESRAELPSDHAVLGETSCWRAHVSVDEQCLVVEVLDYHPGLLYLEVEDLERALEQLRARGKKKRRT
jgi:hypothetical protein